MSSAHALSSIAGFDQATPMLLFGFAFIIITILRVGFYETLSKWGFVISSNTIEVDENLPNFFTAVKLSDCDWLVKENDYVKENYKFAFANESVVRKLDDFKLPKKPISGIAWYNLLANPAYVRGFNYISVDVTDREDLIVDGDSEEGNDCEQSDMVSILINLAYVKQEAARTFTFTAGYSKTFGLAVETAQKSVVNIN